MGSAILRNILIVLAVSINNGCGFLPLHNNPNSMDMFKNIRIQADNTFIAFLIKEALEDWRPKVEVGISQDARGLIQIKNDAQQVATPR